MCRQRNGLRDRATCLEAPLRGASCWQRTWRERKRNRINARTGLSAAIQESDRLSSMCVDAETAVARFPAATSADLRAKLAFMVKQQMGDGTEWLSMILTDAERIVAREG